MCDLSKTNRDDLLELQQRVLLFGGAPKGTLEGPQTGLLDTAGNQKEKTEITII